MQNNTMLSQLSLAASWGLSELSNILMTLKDVCLVLFLKVLNVRRVVSIRFQPALVIISTKNSYGLIFDRSPFLKIFLQVLSEITSV